MVFLLPSLGLIVGVGAHRSKGLTFISPVGFISGQVIYFPSLQGIPYNQVKWVSTSYKLGKLVRFLASRNSLGISTSYSSHAADNNRKKLSANFSHYIDPVSFKVKGNKFFFLVVSVGQICDL